MTRRKWHAPCNEIPERATSLGKSRMHDSMRGYGDRNGRTTFERVAEQALSYLRSRTADHWLMFLAGLVIGLIIG